MVSGDVVVVNSTFGGSCKEASRDDVYEALFHDLSQKYRLRQACTVKQTPESNSHTSVQGRADPKRQSWKRMSTVQYARLGKENGSSKARGPSKSSRLVVRRVPPASGVEVDADAMSEPIRPGTKPCLGSVTFKGGGPAAKGEPSKD